MFARLLTLLCVVTLLSSFTLISEANASSSLGGSAREHMGFERETYCVPHGEDPDGWINEGLGIADIPNTPFWHNALRGQAFIESRFQPAPWNLRDGNSSWLGQQSEGLEQVIPMAWYSTRTGNLYPFRPCAFDPAVSAAVRGELFWMGWWH